MNIIESSNKYKEKIRNKSVLLFSGGMDCLCLNQIYKPDILLHIDYGGKYGKSEKKSINKLIKIGAIDKNKLININIGKWLGNNERKDLIIPNRNIYFVTLASNFGETIYLASVYGDRSFDKDKKFYRLMINLLNHVWDEQHWTKKREFKVISPIKNLTKTQLVKKFLKNKGNSKWLLKSYSCYEGKSIACGKCKPCWRKWVALKNNNIEIPKKYYKNNPKNIPWLKEILPKLKKGIYRGKEDKEILKAHNI